MCSYCLLNPRSFCKIYFPSVVQCYLLVYWLNILSIAWPFSLLMVVICIKFHIHPIAPRFFQLRYFHLWHFSCLLLELAITVFINLHFQTLWPKWLIFWVIKKIWFMTKSYGSESFSIRIQATYSCLKENELSFIHNFTYLNGLDAGFW